MNREEFMRILANAVGVAIAVLMATSAMSVAKDASLRLLSLWRSGAGC